MGTTHWIFIWSVSRKVVSVWSARFMAVAGTAWEHFVEATWNAEARVYGFASTEVKVAGVILNTEKEAVEPTLNYALGFDVTVWPFDTPAPLPPEFNKKYIEVMKTIEKVAAEQGRRLPGAGTPNVKLLGPGGLASITGNIVASIAMEEIREARANAAEEDFGAAAFTAQFRRPGGWLSHGVSGSWGAPLPSAAEGLRIATKVFNTVMKAMTGGMGPGVPAPSPVSNPRPAPAPSSSPTYGGGSGGRVTYGAGGMGGGGRITYGRGGDVSSPYGTFGAQLPQTPLFGGSVPYEPGGFGFDESSGPGEQPLVGTAGEPMSLPEPVTDAFGGPMVEDTPGGGYVWTGLPTAGTG